MNRLSATVKSLRKQFKMTQEDLSLKSVVGLRFVLDLAAGVIAALEKGRRGETYILGNDVVTFKDFARILSEESGCRRIRLFLPCPLVRKLASFMEKRAARKGTKPLLTTSASL